MSASNTEAIYPAPILFSAPMVRAIRREIAAPGTGKTETRRILNPQPETFRLSQDDPMEGLKEGDEARVYLMTCEGDCWPRVTVGRCITGRQIRRKPGMRLWVRESWWIATRYSYGSTPGGSELPPPPLARRGGDPVHYAADGDPPNCHNKHYGPDGLRGGLFAAPDPYATWVRKPAIHMPMWANRLTLTLAGVRIQRLQDMDDTDAIREGVQCSPDGFGELRKPFGIDLNPGWACGDTPLEAFRVFWDLLNEKAHPWRSNPFVLVQTFRPEARNVLK